MKKHLPLFLSFFCTVLLTGAELVVPRPGKLSKGVAVFPELQPDYSCGLNFCNPPHWNDRPLYMDRSCRKKGNRYEVFTDAGLEKELGIVRKYQLNGLSLLGRTKDMIPVLNFCKKYKFKDFRLLPASYDMKVKDMSEKVKPKNFEDMVQLADSPYVFKINGKMVINSYESTNNPPEQWKKLLDSVRKKYGDKFYFVADMKNTMMFYRWRYFEFYNRKNPPELEQEIERRIQRYLDVCDGVQVSVASGCLEPDGAIGMHYQADYIRSATRLIRRIMAKPQNKGKLLACSVSLGYLNAPSGSLTDEEGTGTLRASMEAALSVDPDYIVPFEWNEWYENTCVMPTVRRGNAACRLLRCYNDAANGRRLTPLAGDDPAIPNLVLSCRSNVKYGEKIHLEILNIPDGTGKGTVSCTLCLRNETGKTVYTSPVVKLNTETLSVENIKLPSEQFVSCRALTPELEIVTPTGKKLQFDRFPPVILHATHHTDYLYSKLPLRDVLAAKSDFKVTEQADGSFRIQGKISAAEELANVDILDHHLETAAIGDTEYNRKDEVVFRVTNSSLHWLTFRGALTVANSPDARLRGAQVGGRDNVVWNSGTHPHGLKLNQGVGGHRNFDYLLSVPRKDLDKAELRFDGTMEEHRNKTIRPLHFSIPLKNAVQMGASGVELEPGTRWGVELWNTEPDIALPLKKKEVSFDLTVRSNEKLPIFSIRAVSVNGRRWQSKVCPFGRLSGKTEVLPVYSESVKKVIPLTVAAERIPDLNYQFDPRSGCFFVCGTSRALNGEIGGGYSGSRTNHSHNLPISVRRTGPQWMHTPEDGHFLRFDGNYTAVSFYSAVWPLGCFTVDFSIRPAENGKCILLHHAVRKSAGSIGLFIVNGKLVIGSRHTDGSNTFVRTPLAVMPGKWNDVQVASDLNRFYVTVNGQKWVGGKAVRGFQANPLSFGGDRHNAFLPEKEMKYFAGDLRKLRIRHGFFAR